MNKKMVSIITLIVFIGFTFSCTGYTTKKLKVGRGGLMGKKKPRITTVFTKSGDLYEFSRLNPAFIMGDEIVGNAIDETGETKSVTIPLSEADVVWVIKADRNKTLLRVFAGLGLLDIYMIVRIATSDPSCPFIYSFDGTNYILDAEPFAGAVCRGLKRTEWCGLEHLQEVNGEYRLVMTNELDETEYVDLLRLLVVDHPGNVRAVPDAAGKVHTIASPAAPLRAYDREGNDLSLYVSENDRRVWLSRDDAINPERKETLKEELIFEFRKPVNASSAKLLFNGGSTLLGSKTLKYYLELYGEQVTGWYDEVKNLGPAFLKMANTALREELYSLQVRVETGKGWESRGMVLGGPFFISKEKVYTIDLAGIPGDTLRIKLTPPAGSWKIDYLAVDYSNDSPVNVTEIKAVKGIFNDDEAGDAAARLAESDNNYLVMPTKGDMVELVFQAPPRSPGMERTVILEAGGYYEMHLNAGGEPRRDILEKIHTEPGFVLRYALKEYTRWKKQALSSH